MATEKNAPPLIEQVRMLLAAKAEVDAALRDGGTPLLAAAYKGHDACVAALLQHGAYVDAARADGLTPLCQASKAGHTRCVELLLEGGANVEAAGAVYGTTSLLMASKGGHKHIVELLLRHRADTEVAGRAYGTTSLVAAAHQGHSEVVSLLLHGRADPYKKLNDGATALSKAREAGHVEVVHVLLEAMGCQVYEPSSPSAAPSARAVSSAHAALDLGIGGAVSSTDVGSAHVVPDLPEPWRAVSSAHVVPGSPVPGLPVPGLPEAWRGAEGGMSHGSYEPRQHARATLEEFDSGSRRVGELGGPRVLSGGAVVEPLGRRPRASDDSHSLWASTVLVLGSVPAS